MKFKYFYNIIFLIKIILLIPTLSYAKSVDFVTLLDNIIQLQPEQQVIKGISEIHFANQDLSNSWIAGDINLIIHHENDALTDNDKYQNWQLGVEFPIWLPSQKNAQKSLTTRYGEELSVQKIYLRWLASKKLRDLVWQYQMAKIKVEAASSALQQSQSLQYKIQQKVNAGESPKFDLLLAKKLVLEQKNQLVQRQSSLTIAQNQFYTWTQVSSLPEDILEKTLSPFALDQHPKIIKLTSILRISQAMLQRVKSFKQQSPSILLSAQQDQYRNTDNTSLIVEVSIPLGMNPSYSTKIAKGKRSIYEKQAIIDRAKIQINQNIFKARQKLASAKQSILFSMQQYNISQEALLMSEQAYQLGETNIQNLLLVQQQSVEAKLNYQLVQARSGQAIANLNQVLGHILGAQK